ncbi:MAG TPA: hypothetical protein VNX88_16805 [Terriglobales bacterium]|nr:hypothetical protein [Terriglobales bacterium]
MPPSELLLQAVAELSARSGHVFHISPEPVPGTSLFVVHTENHEYRPEYTITSGPLGFRVPFNLPTAAPEDSFFIAAVDAKLRVPDPVRNSADLNRVGRAEGHVSGSRLGNASVLVFSWHLWNTVPWDRRKHTLFDHYTHSIRRFERAEHD